MLRDHPPLLLPRGQNLVEGEDLERAVAQGCQHRGAIVVHLGDESILIKK